MLQKQVSLLKLMKTQPSDRVVAIGGSSSSLDQGPDFSTPTPSVVSNISTPLISTVSDVLYE